MRVQLEIPDGIFHTPKSEQQVAADLREAAAMYWLVRGDIDALEAARVAGAGRPFKDFKEALLAFPNVGLDEDFERSREAPGEDEANEPSR